MPVNYFEQSFAGTTPRWIPGGVSSFSGLDDVSIVGVEDREVLFLRFKHW